MSDPRDPVSLPVRLDTEALRLVEAKLAERTAALLKRASNQEPISPDEFTYVRELTALVAKQQKPRSPWRIRLPVIASLTIVLCITLFLLFRVDTVDIELDVISSRVDLVLRADAYLLGRREESTPVSALTATGWESAELLDGLHSGGADCCETRLEKDATDKTSTIIVGAMKAPNATRIVVERLFHPNVAVISGTAQSTVFPVTRSDPIVFEATGAGKLTQDPPPRSDQTTTTSVVPIVFRGRKLSISLTMDESKLEILQQQPVDQLRFDAQQILVIGDRTNPFTVSTIESGTVTLLDINETRQLRAGDQLRLVATNGWVRTLSVDAEGVHLRFRGTVSSLRLGRGLENLLPTHLALYYAQRNARLFWAGFTWAFLLLLSILQWWRNPT